MKVTTYTAAEANERYGVDPAEEFYRDVNTLTKGEQRVIDALEDEGVTEVVLTRNWENILYATVEHGDLDSLCIMADGHVGLGGINLPALYPTLEEFLEVNRPADDDRTPEERRNDEIADTLDKG